MFGDFDFEQGMPGAQRTQVDNKRYYEILGVNQTASQMEIKKAFQKKALLEHPERGGDIDKFNEIKKAYEVLSNPQKRAAYDQYGEKNMDKGAIPQQKEYMDAFFGQKDKQKPIKTKSVIHPVKCTLEDLYNGRNFKIKVIRDRICKDCKGKGGSTENAQTCLICLGTGKIVLPQTKPPGFPLEMKQICDICCGTGETIPPSSKCKVCDGKRVCPNGKILEFRVEQGTPDGEKYVFKGEADQHPSKEPGSVVFIVAEQKHDVFKRKGADLLITKEISLIESVCGVEFMIKQLDGTQFKVQSKEGQIIQPEQILTIENKGMPLFKNPSKFGNLFILFKVKFPQNLTSDQKLLVKETLMKVEGMNQRQTCEQTNETKTLIKFENNQRNTHHQGGTEANDSDHDDKDEEAGVNCMNQ